MTFCLPATSDRDKNIYMSDPHIFQKSPIVQKVEPGTYWWCACGKSASQPFCDGSHAGTEFTPIKEEITAAKTVAWCACKHSQTKPFCDGSHSRL
jgi:CDGSH iron-sulfur domain-containing protein 3